MTDFDFGPASALSLILFDLALGQGVSVDSKGNIYTAEVDTGKRIQKFIRYGSLGCSGTGSKVVGGPAAAN